MVQRIDRSLQIIISFCSVEVPTAKVLQGSDRDIKFQQMNNMMSVKAQQEEARHLEEGVEKQAVFP